MSNELGVKYDWHESEALVHSLYNQIHTSRFKPDFMVPLSGGGGVLVDMLKLLMPYPRPVTLDIPVARNEFNERLLGPVGHINKEALFRKRILLVEDYLETGQSVLVIKRFVESNHGRFKLACLYAQSKTLVKPNFAISENLESEVEFPWESFRF